VNYLHPLFKAIGITATVIFAGLAVLLLFLVLLG
jgi:hypothetical protein